VPPFFPSILTRAAPAALLFAVVAFGSFPRWEQLVFVLIAVNVVIIPLALTVHPTIRETAAGLVPRFPGGLDSTLLLLIVAIVGTTVAPWQLFSSSPTSWTSASHRAGSTTNAPI